MSNGGRAPTRTRLIDTLPSPSTSPDIKIIVLGSPRTGTNSLHFALETLGYNVYSTMSASFIANKESLYCSEAINIKYKHWDTIHGMQRYSKPDFEKFIPTNTDVLRGFQLTIFTDELLEAYPDAKVILCTRELEGLVESVKNSIFVIRGWWSWDFLLAVSHGPSASFVKNVIDSVTILCGGRIGDEQGLRKYIIEYYQKVRQVVPSHRLLEFSARDGWQPLCEFLGKEVPKEEYPRAMSRENLIHSMSKRWWAVLYEAGWNTLPITCGIGLVVAISFYLL